MRINHPIIIRFSTRNHPIRRRPRSRFARIQTTESSDNRPISRLESSDQALELPGIIRSRHLNRQRRFIIGPTTTGTWVSIPPVSIDRIADTLFEWKEEEKLSRIVDHGELKKNDYNISPSRYIHTGDAETYRPIAEIVAELDAIEAKARKTDMALREILEKIGV